MRTNVQTQEAVNGFIARWKDHGYERGECQSFWLDLLHEVLDVKKPSDYITFENQIKLTETSTNFIDAYIEKTRVLIEQKSIDKDLRKPTKQSDGTMLTAFEQAKRYANELPYSKQPRWVVICNFKSFLIYDMEKPHGEPEEILLENLEREYHRLQFLVEDGNTRIQKELAVSIKAGDLVGKLYDAFLKQYGEQITAEDLHSINVLCVRLVFCLYAEDAGIFSKDQFYWYLIQFKPEQMRTALKELFTVLDTRVEDRDRFIEDKLAEFPYVNGSLFHQQPNEDIPKFTQEIADILLPKASLGFNWSDISPTIFGAVFESTLNPVTRREGGMHYTSIENIHKVIDPLFLNDLKAEFEQIKQEKYDNRRKQKLEAFQDKLAGLTFLDPACGSGNFLTETYISLRRLENEVISLKYHGQKFLGIEQFTPIKVNIRQFYGIEINDFAVTVAMTALWIAESQMMHETERIIKFDLDYLPLKSFTNIHCGNALRMKWASLLGTIPPPPVGAGNLGDGAKFSYIMGNPPFVGYSLQNKEQKDDILSIYVDENGKPYKTAGKIDYVSGWYFKAAQMMQGTNTQTAFVSTNSITQGEQVAAVWKPVYDRFGIHINFAYRTFRWDSEASLKAHVHCVIVGFSTGEAGVSPVKQYTIYENERAINVNRINPYLVNADNIWIESRKEPLCDVPDMVYGNKPTDGGFLFVTEEERESILNAEPFVEKYIRKIYGATEYINNKARYCLWLVNSTPDELRKSKVIKERVSQVRAFRLNSPKDATQRSADTPHLFQEIRHPDSEYIIIPRHSSENRRYIPFGFVSPEIIVNDAVQIIPHASLYHFGVLMSNVHMAWMRAVCGRLEMRYRYSKDIVYNNFPWPTPTDNQKSKIEQTAQAILDARALYPDSSLADLYDEVTMPPELRKAHEANDKAVMDAYGFNKGVTEADIVAQLFNLYEKLVSSEDANKTDKPVKKRSRKS